MSYLISLCTNVDSKLSVATEHESNCSHPKKSGADVMLALQANDVKLNEERKLFSTLVDLLSYEKMLFTGKTV